MLALRGAAEGAEAPRRAEPALGVASGQGYPGKAGLSLRDSAHTLRATVTITVTVTVTAAAQFSSCTDSTNTSSQELAPESERVSELVQRQPLGWDTSTSLPVMRI